MFLRWGDGNDEAGEQGSDDDPPDHTLARRPTATTLRSATERKEKLKTFDT